MVSMHAWSCYKGILQADAMASCNSRYGIAPYTKLYVAPYTRPLTILNYAHELKKC